MASLREIITTWGFKVDAKPLTEAERKVNSLKKAMVKTAAVASGLLAAIALPSIRLESAISDALSLTGLVGKSFDDLQSDMRDQARRTASVLGFSAEQVSEAYYQTLSTGAVALSDDFNSLTDTALKLAKVGKILPSQAIETLNDALKGFKLPGTEFGRLADVMFKGTILAATNIPQLSQALKVAASTAAASNVPLEETVATLAAFAETGTKGAEAGTSFRQVLIRLTNKTGPGAKAMQKLIGVTAFANGKFKGLANVLAEVEEKTRNMSDEQRTATIAAIAGEEAFSKLAGLLTKEGIGSLRRFTTELEGASGVLGIAFDQKLKGTEEQLRRVAGGFIQLAGQIGDTFTPTIAKAAKYLADFLEVARQFVERNSGVVSALTHLGIAVVGISSAIAVAATAFQVLQIAAVRAAIAMTARWLIAAAPFIGLILLIEELYALFSPSRQGLIEKWFDDLRSEWKDLDIVITDITEKVKTAIGWISKLSSSETQSGNSDFVGPLPAGTAREPRFVDSLAEKNSALTNPANWLPTNILGNIGKTLGGAGHAYAEKLTLENIRGFLSGSGDAVGAGITIQNTIDARGMEPNQLVEFLNRRDTESIRKAAAALGR